jgi:hypothetical protein
MHVSNRWSRPPLQKQMFCLAVSAWTGGVQRIRGVVVGDDVLAFDFVSLSLPNHCMYVFVEIVILRRTLSYPRYPTLFFLTSPSNCAGFNLASSLQQERSTYA